MKPLLPYVPPSPPRGIIQPAQGHGLTPHHRSPAQHTTSATVPLREENRQGTPERPHAPANLVDQPNPSQPSQPLHGTSTAILEKLSNMYDVHWYTAIAYFLTSADGRPAADYLRHYYQQYDPAIPTPIQHEQSPYRHHLRAKADTDARRARVDDLQTS